VVGLDDAKLADIVKTVIKDLASEIVSKGSIAQVLDDAVKKLADRFRVFQITVKIERDGKVSIWIFTETM
jgi:ADP-dependent phosphofructokinase/glucokinase